MVISDMTKPFLMRLEGIIRQTAGFKTFVFVGLYRGMEVHPLGLPRQKIPGAQCGGSLQSCFFYSPVRSICLDGQGMSA
jgi:hypothetical protein